MREFRIDQKFCESSVSDVHGRGQCSLLELRYCRTAQRTREARADSGVTKVIFTVTRPVLSPTSVLTPLLRKKVRHNCLAHLAAAGGDAVC